MYKKISLASVNSFRQKLPRSRLYISANFFATVVLNGFFINKLSAQANTILPTTKVDLISLIQADSFFSSLLVIGFLYFTTVMLPIPTESFSSAVVNELRKPTADKFAEQIKDAKTPEEVASIIKKAKKL